MNNLVKGSTTKIFSLNTDTKHNWTPVKRPTWSNGQPIVSTSINQQDNFASMSKQAVV